jgi:hypothetical protein
VVEHLPSKHEALSSNHSTAKKRKKFLHIMEYICGGILYSGKELHLIFLYYPG